MDLNSMRASNRVSLPGYVSPNTARRLKEEAAARRRNGGGSPDCAFLDDQSDQTDYDYHPETDPEPDDYFQPRGARRRHDDDDDDDLEEPDSELSRRIYAATMQGANNAPPPMPAPTEPEEAPTSASSIKPENIVPLYKLMMAKWILPPGDMLSDIERCARLADNFKINVKELLQEDLQESYEEERLFIEKLLTSVERLASHFPDGQAEIMRKDLNKVYHICNITYQGLESIARLRLVTISSPESNAGRGYLLTDTSEEQKTPKQDFTCHLYTKASHNLFRKSKNMLYAPVTIPGGANTHAFREAMSIHEFVKNNCNRHLGTHWWNFVTGERKGTAATIADIAETIASINDMELPNVVRDRHKFSFRNGIFLTRLERGQPLTTAPSKTPTRERRFYSRFVPYNHPDFDSISDREISAKFFDMDFVDYPEDEHPGDWYNSIPTPTLQYMLRFQYGRRDDCEEICRQFYRDIGRLFFNRGDLDNWQYGMFLIGQAGTGKSTIIENFLKHIHEASNIADISNKIEAQFGVGALMQKDQIFFTTGAEIDHSCQLNRADLLKIVSGEDVTGAVKGGSPLVHKWPSHTIWAGNEFPANWKDTADSIGRRFLMYYFNYKIGNKNVQTDLNERLMSELPMIVSKCVRAYHEAVNVHGSAGIWSFCPRYFLETRDQLKKETNAFHAFMMDSANVVVSPTLMVSEIDLTNEFKEFTKTRGIHNASLQQSGKIQAFRSAIQELNDNFNASIDYRAVPEQMYCGDMHYGAWFFFGLGLTSKLTEAQKHQFFAKPPPVIDEEDDLEKDGAEDDAEAIATAEALRAKLKSQMAPRPATALKKPRSAEASNKGKEDA